MKAILKIDNKEIEVFISDEQLWKLKKKSPFVRRIIDGEYYCIMSDGEIHDIVDKFSMTDNGRFYSANYCSDKDLLQQQAWRETLNRLLWRWQYENDEPVCWGNYACRKWYIVRSVETENVFSSYNTSCQKLNTIYFSSEDKAKQAIEEVVMPFMEEHPYFIW